MFSRWMTLGTDDGTRLYRVALSTFMSLGLLLGDRSGSSWAGDLPQMIREFSADLGSLDHRYRLPLDIQRQQRREQILVHWLDQLADVEFSSLDRSAQLDYLLFKNKLGYLQGKMMTDWHRDQAVAQQFLPFADDLLAFCRNREDVIPSDAAEVAGRLAGVAQRIEQITAQLSQAGEVAEQQRLGGLRAVELLRALRQSVDESDAFYLGFDPQYSWWCKQPMERLRASIDGLIAGLRDQVVGVSESDDQTIIGQPIGADELARELTYEWIAHAPHELIALAEREMDWCEEQLRQASQALGCGNDWRRALETVKSRHVPPGNQPELIQRLAMEAMQFVQQRDLVTIPPLAAGGWRMTMMSPERQRQSPYFLGGDTIIVSFPTDAMTHEEKLMSLRSNNEHFARATVHHELIPGHFLQYFMLARHRPYRQLFATAFWMEGWALHWEMLLWDLDFARGPEDRLGMLFWRKHRCARIVFSLNFHLGDMTPQQCVDYLVEQVGHERSAATAEVRRSVMGNYGALYQAAYMLGGLQLRKLHQEMVSSGRMSARQFHDAVLKEHSMPIELLRDYLTGAVLNPDAVPQWRFAD